VTSGVQRMARGAWIRRPVTARGGGGRLEKEKKHDEALVHPSTHALFRLFQVPVAEGRAGRVRCTFLGRERPNEGEKHGSVVLDSGCMWLYL
jgi:hypothetical protein